MDIKLYKGGESHLQGHANVLKLSSNENPYGPSPAAIAAMRDAASQMHRYPSTDHGPLRAAIARTHGVDDTKVIIGVGSDEIIHFLCQCYAGPGDEVLYTRHGFSMYRISALAAGATPVQVDEKERVVDVAALLNAVTPRTKLVFVTNPGNPTGTRLSTSDLNALADGLPGDVLLVLDGAYTEFAEGYDGGASLVDAAENVVMLRTFSKAYGLGGLRVGWGYGAPGVIDTLNRIRGPFNVGLPQLAAAEAALGDTAFFEKSIRENARLRTWLQTELRMAGIACDDSNANYVLARFQSPEEAQAADARLRADGIIVRAVGGYGFPEGLRITVGDEAGCARVMASIHAFRGAVA